MNLFRGLIGKEEISLTLIDTTQIVNEGIALHGLSASKGYLFGKTLSLLAFFAACLKEEKGEISLSVQREGKELIGASGNRALNVRGYIADGCVAEEALADGGSFTVVRDDGYSRPFVGSCAFAPSGGMDDTVEEYYRISEQLPTRIRTLVLLNEGGRCAFAGVIALQPLPFASLESLAFVEGADLDALLKKMQTEEVEETAKGLFEGAYERRKAAYKCNCSRGYLSSLLLTLGEAQLREIILTEGAVRVHCHYCNTDYVFTGEDVDRLFPKKI